MTDEYNEDNDSRQGIEHEALLYEHSKFGYLRYNARALRMAFLLVLCTTRGVGGERSRPFKRYHIASI